MDLNENQRSEPEERSGETAYRIVALAASAGGLSALGQLFGGLPHDFPVPIVVVQHLDPRHRSLIAEILSKRTSLEVHQATHGDKLKPGCIYIAPPDHHLLVNKNGTLSLSQSELVHFVRPSANLLFDSMAASYGEEAIAVVLTGSGKDGEMGVKAVKDHGGIVIAQNEATSEHFGMPGTAISTKCVDFILALDEIAPALITLVRNERKRQKRMNPEQEKDPAFEHLLKYLKQSRGFDFTEYKRASLMRRVKKRMSNVGIEEFEQYEDYLEVHAQELTQLFNMILINVTSFFRDREAWDYISKEVIPGILAAKTPTSIIRVWSAGCATGEEAYSLAILLAESLGIEDCHRQVKIYATDIDEDALEQARKGIYSAKSIENIPEELQEKYFDVSDSSRSVFRQDLRRILVFGKHDLMQDAPISRLDLLLCRNTLIYFNREAQQRIVARFHFALKETGYLFLGRAETLLTHDNVFKPVDMKHHIFQKISFPQIRDRADTNMQAIVDANNENSSDNQHLKNAAFENTHPAQVVIDHQGSLILANEAARTRFGLDLRDLGHPFRDLELSYRPLELRSLIDQAREDHHSITARDVESFRPGENGSEYLDVTITPLWNNDGHWMGTAINFTDATDRQELKVELEQVRSELENVQEELHTTNEELQSANEEMETMNEELQSSNFELQTMNEQLRSRTVELNRLNAFLESILASVNVGVVVINREFIIELWNDHAEDLWGLRADKVTGVSLLDLDIGLPVDDLRVPIERFLAGKGGNKKIHVNAINRKGQAIKCIVTRTIRQDLDGDLVGVVLLMEEDRK